VATSEETDLEAEPHTPRSENTNDTEPSAKQNKIAVAAPHGRIIGEEGVRPGAKFHKLHPGQSTQAPTLALQKQESETFSQWEGGEGWLRPLVA
jgi:hypothetical protein